MKQLTDLFSHFEKAMKQFFKSLGYAIKGITAAVVEQRNLKIQLFFALIVIAFGFYFDISQVEWFAIIFCIALVLGFEMINTALEDLVDLVTSEWKPLAGRVKDVAAGATLIASIASVIVGFLVFWKYLVLLIG